MPAKSNPDQATALVREGWDHLQCQRPLAAWASWQRALRVEPASIAAAQALATLESATDLAAAARMHYRFRQPADPDRRRAWDDRLRGSNAEDLAATAAVFGRLAEEGAPDSAAWFNRALCLAWSGDNRGAVEALDQAVRLDAPARFDDAVLAWTLAEVLRQGGGAEALADDLRFACTIAWRADETATLLAEYPELEHIPTPREPGAPPERESEIQVFEWYDRPLSAIDDPTTAAELPVVLASVYIHPRSLRLSSPRVQSLEHIEEVLLPRLPEGDRAIRREASPLPLAFLDADLWSFRIPPATDPRTADQLRRAAVESYFENEWIHRPRQGTGGLSPLAAARVARAGDVLALARLTAVVRMREQLGARPSARLLYQGYPFDRLRRRLGLEPEQPDTVDPGDLSCASGHELDRIDPLTLDDTRLVDAMASAAGLRDDARTARFAREYLDRNPRTAPGLDLATVVSPLIRLAIAGHDPDRAVGWIDRARPLADARTVKTLETWRAEILARARRPEGALAVYRALITPDIDGAATAVDAAETMLDNGHFDQAETLLKIARDLARRAGRAWIDRRVRALEERLP